MAVKLLLNSQHILATYYKINRGQFGGISISLARPYRCWKFLPLKNYTKAEKYPVGGNCITLWTDQ